MGWGMEGGVANSKFYRLINTFFCRVGCCVLGDFASKQQHCSEKCNICVLCVFSFIGRLNQIYDFTDLLPPGPFRDPKNVNKSRKCPSLRFY
mgnify:CR=1 FL=1